MTGLPIGRSKYSKKRSQYGGPPGPRPAPWPAFAIRVDSQSKQEAGQGPAADQGVRRTDCGSYCTSTFLWVSRS